MSCGSCVAKIEARLLENPAISEASVTLKPPQAVVVSSESMNAAAMNDWLKPLERYRVSQDFSPPSTTTYRPLIILLVYLLLVVAAVSVAFGHWDSAFAMRVFMGGFFIAFSFFKMLDLRGFADAYRSYDIVAKAFPSYGFVYPFIELSLGLAYLANLQPQLTNAITALVMAVSLVGVLRSVLSKKAIRCACLGTVFNLPMSTVTVVEDGTMLGMALLALLFT
ncbi:MAG: hypothetical protein RL088_635 [Verrucomicrobiota bacterium]